MIIKGAQGGVPQCAKGGVQTGAQTGCQARV